MAETPVPHDPIAAAYLDATRFPLTTQRGLDLQKQKMIDAINKDDIQRMIDAGQQLSPRLQARWREFEEKAKLGQPVAPGGAAPGEPSAPAAT